MAKAMEETGRTKVVRCEHHSVGEYQTENRSTGDERLSITASA
jgi:hypothetical protein